MAVSTAIFFSLVLFCISDVHAVASLSALERRLLLVEGEILASKRTALNSDITLNNKFEVFKSSLKEELIESVIPPLIKPFVIKAVADILDEDNIENIISRHVLDEVHSLKASLENTKTQLIERERDTYRRGLGKLRHRLTKDIRAVQLQLKQTSDDLHDTQQKLNGLTEDFITLNTSYVMVRKAVETCTDGLQEIQLKLPTDFQSTPLNETNEDLLDTKRVIHGLTGGLITLNISLGIKKDVKPSEGNESSLASSSLSQVPLTASTMAYPETTAASTDPIQDPSQTVPPVPGTTQNADQHASTDPIQDPSQTVPPVPETTQDSDQHATPSPATGDNLYNASRDGDLETVRRILSAGHVDINYRGRYSWTPVMVAAYNGHRDVVEFLVGEGADVTLVDKYDYNILHFACRGGYLEIVKLIVSLNVVDINSIGRGNWTPIMSAARSGHRDVVEFLVGKGADVSIVDQRGYNILHLACLAGDLETVKLILSLNLVDINVRTNGGETAADMAKVRGQQQVLDYLVSRGGHWSV